MNKFNLPTPVESTLSVIASQGILSAISRRIDGGVYNRILITTKAGVFLVDPLETLVLNIIDDKTVVVEETHKTVVNGNDMHLFNRVESRGILEEDQRHYKLGFTVTKGRPEQMITIDEVQAKNLHSILEELEGKRDGDDFKVHGKGHVENGRDSVRELVIYVDIKEMEYEYTYDLSTRELTKEEI